MEVEKKRLIARSGGWFGGGEAKKNARNRFRALVTARRYKALRMTTGYGFFVIVCEFTKLAKAFSDIGRNTEVTRAS